MLYCIYCGTPLEDGDLFCTGCGQPVANTENIHMMPGREPVRQGSLDPTNPDSRPETYSGAGGLHYGENGGSGGLDGGDDPDSGNNRIAVIIAAVAIAVIVCAFFLLLTGGVFNKDKDTKEEEAVAYQESGSGEEESDSVPGDSGQADEDEEITGDGEDFRQPEEEVSAAEPAEKEETPVSSEAAGDEDKEGAGAAHAGEQSSRQTDQADLGQASETPLGQQKSETGTQNNASAQKRAEEEQKKKDAAARENRNSADSNEKQKEESVASAGTDSSYILAESDKRTYSREELSRLDDYTLQMAINELYARHGRRFKTPEVQEYFDGKSWYNGTISPDAFDGNEAAYFNNYETKNRELMAKIRDERAAAAAGGQR